MRLSPHYERYDTRLTAKRKFGVGAVLTNGLRQGCAQKDSARDTHSPSALLQPNGSGHCTEQAPPSASGFDRLVLLPQPVFDAVLAAMEQANIEVLIVKPGYMSVAAVWLRDTIYCRLAK
jgi:hypothetical protein